MQNISINFIVPQGWHELGDKQLRYVYQLLASDCSCQRGQRSNLFEPMPSAAELGRIQFSADEIKTLCLLQWSDTKVIGKQPSGAYLLRKGKTLFEATPLTIAELLPHLGWLGSTPTGPVRMSKVNRREALPVDFPKYLLKLSLSATTAIKVILLRKTINCSTNSEQRSMARKYSSSHTSASTSSTGLPRSKNGSETNTRTSFSLWKPQPTAPMRSILSTSIAKNSRSTTAFLYPYRVLYNRQLARI